MAVVAPSPQEIQQVAEIIRSGFESVNDPSVQVRVNQFLQEHAADAKFNVCLIELATAPGSGLADITRAQSAWAFKENVVRHFDTAVAPNVAYLREKLKAALHDQSALVRQALGPCISEVAKTGHWPTLVSELWPQMVQSSSSEFRQAVLICIKDVCTYCAFQLEEVQNGTCQARILVPELVAFVLKADNPKEIAYAMQALYSLLDYESEEANSPIYVAFEACLQQTLHALDKAIKLGQDPNGGEVGTQITIAALRCYRLLLYYYKTLKRMEAIGGIMQVVYNLTASSPNPDIALTACEFWRDLATDDTAVADLLNVKLVPDLAKMLLQKMVLDEFELAEIEAEQDQAHRGGGSKKAKRAGGDDDDDDEGEVELWTLRRCAGGTLESLGKMLGANLLSPPGHPQDWFLQAEVLPRLQAQTWKEQESAVLALGALADGCRTEVEAYLTQLFPHLMSCLENQSLHFMVRSTALWALDRYVSWIHLDEAKFAPYLQALLRYMHAPHRTVQKHAVSSFAGLLTHDKECGEKGYLVTNPAYVDAIIDHLAQCLQPGRYTDWSLVILYDSIRVLAEGCGPQLATPAGHQKLLQPLIQHHLLRQSANDVLVLPALLYALSSIIFEVGAEFVPYRTSVFTFCLEIVGKFYEAQFGLKDGRIRLEDLPDFGNNPAAAADMVGVFLEASNYDEADYENVKQMIVSTNYPGTSFGFLDLALIPLTQPDVFANCDQMYREYVMRSLSFVGDYLKVFPDKFAQPVMQALPNLLEFLNEDTSLCSDVAWFCGEVISTMSPSLPAEQSKQLVGQVANLLVPILIQKKDWDENLLKQVALAVGKFGLVQAGLLAPALDSFFVPLTQHIGLVEEFGGENDEPSEKAVAFNGVIKMLEQNFGVLEKLQNIKSLAKVMNTFIGLEHSNPELLQKCVVIASNLRSALGAQWNGLKQHGIEFPDCVLRRLG